MPRAPLHHIGAGPCRQLLPIIFWMIMQAWPKPAWLRLSKFAIKPKALGLYGRQSRYLGRSDAERG